MARLTDTRTGPPGGWRYVQPETGAEIIAPSYPALMERVIEHRRYKRIGSVDLTTVTAEVERQICSGVEARFCRAEDGEDYQPTVDVPGGLTISKVTSASAAFIEFLKGGFELVAKAESERRAAICRGCRFNRNADGCGACSFLFKAMELAIPTGRLEPGIKACSVCGCALKAKVLMPRAVIEESNQGRDVRYPSHCWQN
jgi:hypothetical protein